MTHDLTVIWYSAIYLLSYLKAAERNPVCASGEKEKDFNGNSKKHAKHLKIKFRGRADDNIATISKR